MTFYLKSKNLCDGHPISSGMSIPVELETPMDIDVEYSPVQPWEKTRNPIQEQLVGKLLQIITFFLCNYKHLYHNNGYYLQLNYVLDKKRPAEEIIVKEGQTCLTRDEFWSLGLGRYMDANVSSHMV